MAKKVRRVRRKASKKDKETTSTPTEEQLREEYTYVLKDLRRMFLLAAIMFGLLIAINILI